MAALRGLRVAVTVPPAAFFGGYAFQYASAMIAAIEGAGANVFRYPITPHAYADLDGIRTALADLKSFQPDLAVGTHDAGYGLSARLPSGGGDLNVFTDVFQLPTLMLWDHPHLQFPAQLLRTLPLRPEESVAGAQERMRRALSHPLFHHVARDSGHIELMDRLDLVPAHRVRRTICWVDDAFLDSRPTRAQPGRDRVVFVGNLYGGTTEALRAAWPNRLRTLADAVVARIASDPAADPWALLTTAIARLSPDQRHALRLESDQSYFWTVVGQVLGVAANQCARMAALAAIPASVDFYGDFNDTKTGPPVMLPPNVRRQPQLFAYPSGLARLFARADLLVDVTNAGFRKGMGTKALSCVATGTPALFNWRADLVTDFGTMAKDLMYRDHAELGAKVDRLLSHPRERRDLAASWRVAIDQRCRISRLIPELVRQVADIDGDRPRRSRSLLIVDRAARPLPRFAVMLADLRAALTPSTRRQGILDLAIPPVPASADGLGPQLWLCLATEGQPMRVRLGGNATVIQPSDGERSLLLTLNARLARGGGVLYLERVGRKPPAQVRVIGVGLVGRR